MTIAIQPYRASTELLAFAELEEDPRIAAKLRAIAWCLDGTPRAVAAERAGIDKTVLRDAIKRYNEGGSSALGDRPRSGSPRAGTLQELYPDLTAWYPAERNVKPAAVLPIQSSDIVCWKCWSCHSHGVETYYTRRVADQVRGWKSGAGVCTDCRYVRTSKSHRNRALVKGISLAAGWEDLCLEYRADNPIPASEITGGSKTPVWWVCARCGHEWPATPYTRTRMGCGCNHCSRGSSRIELRLYAEFAASFPDALRRHTADRALPEMDIYLPGLDLAIEVDGGYYHRDRLDQDLIKNRKLKEAGIRLIRLRHHTLEPIDPCILVDLNLAQEEVFRRFLEWLAQAVPELSCFARERLAGDLLRGNALYDELTALMPLPPKGKSLPDIHPWVKDVWSPVNVLGPEYYTAGSKFRAGWLCPGNPDHAYEAEIASRVRNEEGGCPYCQGKKISPERSLAHLKPTIAAEWDALKNGKSATEIFANSSEFGWFICPEGHSWERRISDRKEDKPHYGGCETCKELNARQGSLAALFPLLMRDWDYKSNADIGLDPWEIRPLSNKKACWRCCECNHPWPAVVSSRVRQKTRCPNPACRHSHWT